MSIFKKNFTKPLPQEAEIFTREGQRYARWTDRYGKKRVARVTEGRGGAVRIVLEAATQVIRYRDAHGVVHEVSSGCRSKEAARAVQANLGHRVELIKAGVLSASDDILATHTATPVAGHIDEYLRHMALRACPRHVQNTTRLLMRVIRECAFQRLADLQAAPLVNWLTLRLKEGMGARTTNTYIGALQSFAAWCVADGRLQANPFSRVPKADTKAGCRRRRRALTDEEVARLLKVARLRPLAEYGRKVEKIQTLPGTAKRVNWTRAPLALENLDAAERAGRAALIKSQAYIRLLERRGKERALIYKTLLLTGLRRNELASLRLSQIVLDGNVPHVILNAADEKNRKGATLPLRKDLVEDIRAFLREQGQEAATSRIVPLNPAAKLFKVPRSLVRSLNRDLTAAGIPKVDERGRTVDVHALRHTLGTMLSRAGVPLRTAQALMRHSDPRLTANVYTDPALLDVAGAVQSLPSLPLHAATRENNPAGEASSLLQAEVKPA